MLSACGRGWRCCGAAATLSRRQATVAAHARAPRGLRREPAALAAFPGSRGGVLPLRARRATCARAWQRVHDAASGRDYFWDPASGETAWELPGVADAAAAPPAAAAAADDAGLSNEALLTLFMDYILTPQAKFDYPSPSSEFMELVEAHRGAIYERSDNFYEFMNHLCETTPAGGPPVERSAGAPALAAEKERTQSAAAAGIAMFDDSNMRWNTEVVLTRLEALESVRARLSNPGLRDANPAF